MLLKIILADKRAMAKGYFLELNHKIHSTDSGYKANNLYQTSFNNRQINNFKINLANYFHY